MSLLWARQQFSNAKAQLPIESAQWHLAEGLRQLTDSLDARLREREQQIRSRS